MAAAEVQRFISRERNLLLARADFRPVFEEYVAHSRTWVGDPQGLVLKMMRQGLAAAGLYLTCRPRDETTAWTINLPEPPLNIFVTCDAGAGTVVGRYFTEHVKAAPHNRLIVQTVRSTGEPQLSAIEVHGFDVLRIFEEYYDQSEQLPVRFFELGNGDYLMLVALPGIDEPWLRALTPAEAAALLAAPDTSLIERRPVRFACVCSPEKIHEIVAGVFRGKADELFGDQPSVEDAVRLTRIAAKLSVPLRTRGRARKRSSKGTGRRPLPGRSPGPPTERRLRSVNAWNPESPCRRKRKRRRGPPPVEAGASRAG